MEALGFDNIMGPEDIDNLFTSPEQPSPEEQEEEPKAGKPEAKTDNNETHSTTEAVDPDTLFIDEEEKQEEQPESVGSEKKEAKGQGDAATDEGSDTSPQIFYSSIAQACAVDGIFPNLDLDDEAISKIQDAESFSKLIEDEVNARFDAKQQRLSKALENGVEPADIRRYETTLQYINSISEEKLVAEDEAGEQLRRNVIYQDYVNKGYSQERAQKMTERSIESGNDIEDAKEALQGNRDYFQKKYDELLEDAQRKADEEKAERQKLSKKLEESMLNDKNIAGGMEVSKDIRRRAFDAISKPVYKDPETGEYLTALQKYESENHADFLKYVGLFMAMTNGFKDFDSFTKAEVKKEVNKGMKELERKLNNTRRTSDGGLKMVTTVDDDPDSYYSGDIRLAL